MYVAGPPQSRFWPANLLSRVAFPNVDKWASRPDQHCGVEAAERRQTEYFTHVCASGKDYAAKAGTLQEAAMSRKYIDCREFPSATKCTVAISADTEDELLEVAAQHAVRAHGHEDTPALRVQLKQGIKTGTPPA